MPVIMLMLRDALLSQLSPTAPHQHPEVPFMDETWGAAAIAM